MNDNKPSKEPVRITQANIGKYQDEIEKFKSIASGLYALPKDPEIICAETSLMMKDKGDDLTVEDLTLPLNAYLTSQSLDNHAYISSCVQGDLGSLAIQMARDLYKKYDITSAEEKAYAHMAVIAFCRYLADSQRFEGNRSSNELFNEKIGIMNTYSKDAERSFRQYHTIIQMFEIRRSPKVNINVKTQTAFIAQNQQNNANNPNTNDTIASI